MPRYVVQRYHNAERLGRAIEVEALSERTAAETILGEALIDGDLTGRLAAEVYPSHIPGDKHRFSRPSRRERHA